MFYFKERIAELSTVVQDDDGELKSKIGGENQINLSESDVQQLQKYYSLKIILHFSNLDI